MITGTLTQSNAKDITFGRTLINWDEQTITILYNQGESHIVQMTSGQYAYLKTGMESLLSNIDAVSDVVWPEFDSEKGD